MPQQNILTLAKQGDSNAIAILINKSLNPKGISAEVVREGAFLQIILESSEIPDPSSVVQFLQSDILKLGIPDIETLVIDGRRTGEEAIAWEQEVNLKALPLSAAPDYQPIKRIDNAGLKASQNIPKWIAITLGLLFAAGFLGFAYRQLTPSNKSTSSPNPSTQSPY